MFRLQQTWCVDCLLLRMHKGFPPQVRVPGSPTLWRSVAALADHILSLHSFRWIVHSSGGDAALGDADSRTGTLRLGCAWATIWMQAQYNRDR